MSALPPSPTPVHSGPFTESHARRLLWRAGFGPKRGEAKALARLGLEGAVASLTRPKGAAKLVGPAPESAPGKPIDPDNVWGDDHCWWLDRMVRSTHPLVERMTLIWHSWFATSVDGSNATLMIAQNQMMRGHWLGNFHDLLVDVTKDPAMLLWLNGSGSTKTDPNENYAREVMELFTLGANRGYTQDDVHNQARALTGWANQWGDTGPYGFAFNPDLHDDGVKTIFGKSGTFTWTDTPRLCVEHPLHPSFMVGKLWSYFIPEPPTRATLRALEHAYVKSGYETRPLVEAILRHPRFYDGPRQVTPPVVHTAGMLKALGQWIRTNNWSWIALRYGQRLFEPPNVAGWDYANWFDTARWAGRFLAVTTALQPIAIDPGHASWPADETAEEAVATALHYWDDPELSTTTMNALLDYSRKAQASIQYDGQQVQFRIARQNALRALIPVTPDWQTN